jgi:hypothetical protein
VTAVPAAPAIAFLRHHVIVLHKCPVDNVRD